MALWANGLCGGPLHKVPSARMEGCILRAITLVRRNEVRDSSSQRQRSDTHDHIEWEAQIEGKNTLKERYLLLAEGDIKGIEICLKVFNLSSANDGEDIGCLLHYICNGHCSFGLVQDSVKPRLKTDLR